MPSAVHTLLQHRMKNLIFEISGDVYVCVYVYIFHQLLVEVILRSWIAEEVALFIAWFMHHGVYRKSFNMLWAVPHVSIVPLHSDFQVTYMVCFRAETCVDSETKKRQTF